jgi:hypothetical protein
VVGRAQNGTEPDALVLDRLNNEEVEWLYQHVEEGRRRFGSLVFRPLIPNQIQALLERY